MCKTSIPVTHKNIDPENDYIDEEFPAWPCASEVPEDGDVATTACGPSELPAWEQTQIRQALRKLRGDPSYF